MKKWIFALVALLVFGTGSAMAQPYWTGMVNDGFGNWVDGVQVFDWSDAGSGAALGLADPADVVVGATFDFYYQARLVGLTGPDGDAVVFPNLNDTFEYTLVAQIPEVVSSLTTLPGGEVQAIFRTAGPGAWYIYNDTSPDSNVASGFGFDDGTEVASGTWVVDEPSAFTSIEPGELGIGSYNIDGLVGIGEVNPGFLDPTTFNGQQFIIDISFQGTLNLPAENATTTNFFAGNEADGNFAAYAVTADDLLFKVDSSSRFSVIPEPSTVILMGLGLLGLAGVSRKKFRK